MVSLARGDASATKGGEVNLLAQDFAGSKSILVDQLAEMSTSVVKLTKVAAPYTTVTNRAPVTDFANDLMPKFGIDRIMTQQIMQVQGESGPNGEPVWKPVNDVHDQVRFVGSGWVSVNDSSGPRVRLGGALGNYVEVTFYGTNLNVLLALSGPGNSMTAAVDGGAAGANLIPSSYSSILEFRNYSMNCIVSAIPTQTAGLHTVTLAFSNSGHHTFGFEVINASPTIALPPGTSYASGKKLTKAAADTTPYKTTFENVLDINVGTKGGHVSVYQKSDGTIGKALTPTDAAAGYLTGASHTNEEVIRTHYWREFGAGRADDFSLLSGVSASSRAFTLDDGTTTLVGKDAAVGSVGDSVMCINGGTNGFITLTFVGTGLDIVIGTDVSTRSWTASYVDGGSTLGAISKTASTGIETRKVVSGLSYGTHTVKLENSAGSGSPALMQFIVYGPKTPALPTGAVALSDYFLMGNYAPNTVAGPETIGTGVLRKPVTREMVYVEGTGGANAWVLSTVNVGQLGAFEVFTDKLNAYVEYTFYGVGFEIRKTVLGSGSTDQRILIDGNLLSTAGWSINGSGTPTYGTVTQGTYGTGLVFTPASGAINSSAASVIGVGFWVNGLTLGTHRIRFYNNTSGSGTNYIELNAIDVITPVHSPKDNGPFVVQNTLAIGSQSIRDLRKFGSAQIAPQKMTAQAVKVLTTASTSSTTLSPMDDMSITIKTSGNPVQLQYEGTTYTSAVGVNTFYQFFVDGVAISPDCVYSGATTNALMQPMFSIVTLSPGTHKVDVHWRVDSGTASASRRYMTAREL